MPCKPALLSVLLLAPLLAIAGCVTQYAPPEAAGATASLVFMPNPGGRGTSEKLSLVKDEVCTGIDAGGGVRLSTQNLVWRKADPIVIETGVRLYLRAQGDTFARPVSRTCVNVSSFEPQAGHVYEVEHSDTTRGCRLAVRDRATGAPPPSLVTHEVVDRCAVLPLL